MKPRIFRYRGRWTCGRVWIWSSGMRVTTDEFGDGLTPKAAFDAWRKANR